MKKLLILHCWWGTPEKNWYQYLKEKAQELGYEVSVPQLEDKEKPTLEDWTRSALKDFVIDENTSIVGHSLGSVLGLKLIQNTNIKIDKLVLVSGWDFWDLTPEHKTFFDIPVDHEKIIENSKKVTVVHSSNDPYVALYQAEKMSKRLRGEIIKIENGGHLQASDGFQEFPQLVEVLK